MLRVKDIKKSLAFYRDILGMTVLSEKVMGEGYVPDSTEYYVLCTEHIGHIHHFTCRTDWGFSLYFLAHISEEDLAALPENKIGLVDIIVVRYSTGDFIMVLPVARNMFGPILELTYNHGTEKLADFR